MATVASLFGSQAEASSAIDALAGSEFADVETRVIEEVGADPAEPDVGAIPHLGSSRLSGVLDTGTGDWFGDLDDETARFLARRVQSGGVLLLAKVADAQVDKLESFLKEHGGLTAEDF